jgi:hypothetical protein
MIYFTLQHQQKQCPRNNNDSGNNDRNNNESRINDNSRFLLLCSNDLQLCGLPAF